MDHRLVDGRESVGFLVTIKELLEDPTRIFIGNLNLITITFNQCLP